MVNSCERRPSGPIGHQAPATIQMLFEQVFYIDCTCPPTFRCGAPVTMALSAYQ
jgi:hypothetical protein